MTADNRPTTAVGGNTATDDTDTPAADDAKPGHCFIKT